MSELITLRCKDCENTDCSLVPCGKWIAENSLEGCTRFVSELESVQFNHYINEVVPFLHLNKNKEASARTYNEIIDFLSSIYNKPVGNRLGKSGKILIDKKYHQSNIYQ